jgi:phosphoribosylglycinamide formyltransferase-1
MEHGLIFFAPSASGSVSGLKPAALNWHMASGRLGLVIHEPPNATAIARAAHKDAWQEKRGLRISAVISNRADAQGLPQAKSLDLATDLLPHRDFASRETFDAALMARINLHAPQLVVLVGFMRILMPGFVPHYAGRLLNIHPSLLPAFTGMPTYQRAIDAGCKVSGATVHQVAAELDHGAILAQAVVLALPGDTADTLAARILTQEHLIYP